ncbi:unnamed protein product [Effrenium voratum]|uniref:Uncharacterized protein n=1 Tax=Effrenium voratum TaxID=2562239 RepID=A0AA36ID35_9DINO|nr:unnamed protein product [Effrenium voratum]
MSHWTDTFTHPSRRQLERRSTRALLFPTLRARYLHDSVSPDKWCVTRSDLKFLRWDVQQFISAEQIDSDGSEPDASSEYGPSIYAVTEQYIKPVTALAGKMSWALMMNPEGLEADLFISHAWQEGVFEFISKVLDSWPARAHNAWCCMLANPQHLDIASLLHSPSHSPFALALRASKYVLVVPNRHASIYTRLWCGYEAYLAAESGKIILTAKPSIWSTVWRALCQLVLAGLLGLALGALLRYLLWGSNMNLFIFATLCLSALGSANTAGRWRVAADHIGFALATALNLVWRSEEHSKRLRPTSKVWSEVMTFFPLLVMIFFLLAELDRIMWEARTVECQQLRHGFEGICRASCKEPEDEQRIRAEIGDKVAEVDQAIEVLISAGMSTPALRHVERLGINIDHAGCMELAMPVMFLGPQLLLAIWQDLFNGARRGRWFLVVCQTVSIIARLALLALLCRSGADERCFMLRVMTKLVVLVLVPAFASVCLGAEGDRMMQRTTFLAFDAVFLLTLGFGLLGIRGTAKMPCLMQLLLARGRPLCHWMKETAEFPRGFSHFGRWPAKRRACVERLLFFKRSPSSRAASQQERGMTSPWLKFPFMATATLW